MHSHLPRHRGRSGKASFNTPSISSAYFAARRPWLNAKSLSQKIIRINGVTTDLIGQVLADIDNFKMIFQSLTVNRSSCSFIGRFLYTVEEPVIGRSINFGSVNLQLDESIEGALRRSNVR